MERTFKIVRVSSQGLFNTCDSDYDCGCTVDNCHPETCNCWCHA